MDNFFIHVNYEPRIFPCGFHVSSCGCIPRKLHWEQQSYPLFVYCLVLRGRGTIETATLTEPIRAPALFLLRPGREYRYGPNSSWDELFICVRTEHAAAVTRAGLLPTDRTVWSVRNTPELARQVEEFCRIGKMRAVNRPADRLDRVAERVVMEALSSQRANSTDQQYDAVDAVRRRVEADIARGHDFDALAREHALSPATFRRRWQARVGCPPAQYVMRLRLQEASRLLIETNLPIAAISRRVGLNDVMYFCRRFKRFTGATATEYRAACQPERGRVLGRA